MTTNLLDTTSKLALQIGQCAADLAHAGGHFMDFRGECDHILGRGAASALHEELQQIWEGTMASNVEHLGIAKEAEARDRLNKARKALKRIKPPLWERVHHES